MCKSKKELPIDKFITNIIGGTMIVLTGVFFVLMCLGRADQAANIIPVFLGSAVILLLCEDIKRNKDQSVSLVATQQRYQIMLKIDLQNEKNSVTVVGYSNALHSIESFLQHCRWIEENRNGLTISGLTDSIYIPKKAIQKMSLTGTALDMSMETKNEAESGAETPQAIRTIERKR